MLVALATISVAVSSPVHLIMFAGYSVNKIAIIFLGATLEVKFFFWWPFGDQLFRFSRQRIFLGAKIYVNNKVLIIG